MHRLLVVILGSLVCLLPATALGQGIDAESNFSDRQAVIINNAQPYVSLSDFTFSNQYYNRDIRLITKLKWTNASDKSITAFEVVLLYFDPFNRPMSAGGRWMITGHDSANWTALAPGQSSSDGTIDFQQEKVFTAIVYVRAIRFTDGTVWNSNQAEVEAKIKAAMPTLRELGPLDPGPKPTPH